MDTKQEILILLLKMLHDFKREMIAKGKEPTLELLIEEVEEELSK